MVDFGPTLATEVLLAKHDVQGPETLRTWMLEEGSAVAQATPQLPPASFAARGLR